MHRLVSTFVYSFLLTACGVADGPQVSVNDAMVKQIEPATNTIWGIEDPQTEEEWRVFVEAADIIVDTAESIRRGGTGPNDAAWAQDPAWQDHDENSAAGRRSYSIAIPIAIHCGRASQPGCV